MKNLLSNAALSLTVFLHKFFNCEKAWISVHAFQMPINDLTIMLKPRFKLVRQLITIFYFNFYKQNHNYAIIQPNYDYNL